MKQISPDTLFAHEEIDLDNLSVILGLIQTNHDRVFLPLIVDKNSNMVIDGHHRLEASKRLGLKQIPVIFVDYFSPEIILETKTGLSKHQIVAMAQAGKKLTPKSTFHFVIQDGVKRHVSEVW